MTYQRSLRRKQSKATNNNPTNGQTPISPINLEAYTRHMAQNIIANIDPNVGFVLITSMKDHSSCDHTVIHTFGTREMAVHLLEAAVDHV